MFTSFSHVADRTDSVQRPVDCGLTDLDPQEFEDNKRFVDYVGKWQKVVDWRSTQNVPFVAKPPIPERKLSGDESL